MIQTSTGIWHYIHLTVSVWFSEAESKLKAVNAKPACSVCVWSSSLQQTATKEAGTEPTEAGSINVEAGACKTKNGVVCVHGGFTRVGGHSGGP